ncbi:hypothetical protein Bca101_061844 [Brassica carinata]
MVEFMEKVTELTIEERNLLSVAYKIVIGACSALWRIISSIEQKEESLGNVVRVKTIRDHEAKIESELSVIYDGILKLLESTLIPSAASEESKVFYLKMKGDYYRPRFTFEEHLLPLLALDLYIRGCDFFSTLSWTESDQCCFCIHVCINQAFDAAIAELDTVGEESYKDSTLIMQLQFLRDNLTVWTSEMQDESADKINEAAAAAPKPTEEQK